MYDNGFILFCGFGVFVKFDVFENVVVGLFIVLGFG